MKETGRCGRVLKNLEVRRASIFSPATGLCKGHVSVTAIAISYYAARLMEVLHLFLHACYGVKSCATAAEAVIYGIDSATKVILIVPSLPPEIGVSVSQEIAGIMVLFLRAVALVPKTAVHLIKVNAIVHLVVRCEKGRRINLLSVFVHLFLLLTAVQHLRKNAINNSGILWMSNYYSRCRSLAVISYR